MAYNISSNTTGIANNYGSEQQWKISVSINGTSIDLFDKFTGGDVMSSPNKHRPGGMGPEVTYFSLPTYSDITVTRVYEFQRDHSLVGTLHGLVGLAEMEVSMTPLDANGVAWNPGAIRTYTGRLIGVKDGGTDSNSTAPRMFELDMSVVSLADTVATPSA